MHGLHIAATLSSTGDSEFVAHVKFGGAGPDDNDPVLGSVPSARLQEDEFSWLTNAAVTSWTNVSQKASASNQVLVDSKGPHADERRFVFELKVACTNLNCSCTTRRKTCEETLGGFRDYLAGKRKGGPAKPRGAMLQSVTNVEKSIAELLPPHPSTPDGPIRLLLSYRGSLTYRARRAARQEEAQRQAAEQRAQREAAERAQKATVLKEEAQKQQGEARKRQRQRAQAQRRADEEEKQALQKQLADAARERAAAENLKRLEQQKAEEAARAKEIAEQQAAAMKRQVEEIQAKAKSEAAAAAAATEAAIAAATTATTAVKQLQQQTSMSSSLSEVTLVDSDTSRAPSATAPGPAASPAGAAARDTGKNALDIYRQSHSRWVLGGVAELIHNAADAEASELRIDFEESKGGRILLRDDGIGMAHDAMNNMLLFGRNSDLWSREGTIGKYGIGFKSGSIRCSQSAVVVSHSKHMNTTSYGLLSNLPFEQDPSQDFVKSFVTVDEDGEPTAGCMDDDFEKLMAQFKKYADMTQIKLGKYSQELKESKTGSGTIIILAHLRSNGLTEELELDPSQDSADFVVMSEEEENKKFQLDWRVPRQEGKEVRVDYSLRALCEVIFLEPRMKIYIRGTEVKPVRVQTELTNMKAVTIKVEHAGAVGVPDTPGGKKQRMNPVVAYLGCHRQHAEEWQLSGVLTYQDNGLVVAYGRPGIHGSLGDRLGVLLICSLPSSEFKVNNTKTEFERKSEKSGSMRYPKIRAAFTREFKKYVDECEKDAAAESQALDREEYNAASGIAQDLDWMQCESCDKWRLFGERANMTQQEFKDYAAKYEGKSWCCWFEGSPVEHDRPPCGVPCDFENFANLFDDTTVSQVDLQAASYSQNPSEDDDDKPLGLVRSPSGKVIQAASPAVEHPPTTHDTSSYSASGSTTTARSITPDVKILKQADQQKLHIVNHKCAEGNFCFVHEANFYGQPIALKELKNKCAKAELVKEAGNLSRLKHAAIPQLQFVDPDGSQIGLEWVDGTTLDKCEPHMRESHWSSWVCQIVSALQYIHSQDILHNDLRLSNLMVTTDGQRVKLIDFGLAKLQKADGTFSSEPSFVRSVKYKCPSVVRDSRKALGEHVDVYSLGICVLELATGNIDEVWGQGFTDNQVLQLIINPSTTDHQLHNQLNIAAADLSEALRKIVEGCITVNKDSRLDLNEVERLMEDVTERPKVQFVYHVLEPQDQLEFNESGEFMRLTRLAGGPTDQELSYHVAHGSKTDFRGPFISCTQSPEWAIHFWSVEKSQTDISFPIFKIDISKIAEESRVDLTTKEACRRHGLSDRNANNAYDASEVVFTNGYSGGIPAEAISDVFTLAAHRLDCDASVKKWHDRTKHRRPLQVMVTAAGNPKTKSYMAWNRHFLRVRDTDMNSAHSIEILQEGTCKIDAVVRKEGDTRRNVTGEDYGAVWSARGGPYDRFLAQRRKRKRRRGDPVGDRAALRKAVVGRLYKPSSGPAVPVYLEGHDVIFIDEEPQKLMKHARVVDSGGSTVGKGPDGVTQPWRWDLGTVESGVCSNFMGKGISWVVRNAGRAMALSKLTLSEAALLVSPKKQLTKEAELFAKAHSWLRPGRLLWEIDGSRKKCVEAATAMVNGERDFVKNAMSSARCLTFCSDEEYATWTSRVTAQSEASGGGAVVSESRGPVVVAPSASAVVAHSRATTSGSSNRLKRPFAAASTGSKVAAPAKRTKRQSESAAGATRQARSNELMPSEDTNVGWPRDASFAHGPVPVLPTGRSAATAFEVDSDDSDD